MAIKENREYRNLGAFGIETRADGETPAPAFIVTGYASTFDPYFMGEYEGVQTFEKIDRSAFDDTDKTDVVFLRDHTGTVLARTKNGLIELNTDEHGLHTWTDLSKTFAARQMYEDIAAGNYTQMSFSFIADRNADEYEWSDDGKRLTRIIHRIEKLYDVSAVAFPANPGTDIGVSFRALFDGEIEQRTAERLEAERMREIIRLKIKLAKAKR